MKPRPATRCGALAVDLRDNGDEVPSHDDLFGLLNAFFKQRRRDGAFIDVEERDVIVGDLVKKDDELDEIRVGLLPEGFLTPAEKVVQK